MTVHSSNPTCRQASKSVDYKLEVRVGEKDLLIKVLATKTDNLSLILGLT